MNQATLYQLVFFYLAHSSLLWLATESVKRAGAKEGLVRWFSVIIGVPTGAVFVPFGLELLGIPTEPIKAALGTFQFYLAGGFVGGLSAGSSKICHDTFKPFLTRFLDERSKD